MYIYFSRKYIRSESEMKTALMTDPTTAEGYTYTTTSTNKLTNDQLDDIIVNVDVINGLSDRSGSDAADVESVTFEVVTLTTTDDLNNLNVIEKLITTTALNEVQQQEESQNAQSEEREATGGTMEKVLEIPTEADVNVRISEPAEKSAIASKPMEIPSVGVKEMTKTIGNLVFPKDEEDSEDSADKYLKKPITPKPNRIFSTTAIPMAESNIQFPADEEEEPGLLINPDSETATETETNNKTGEGVKLETDGKTKTGEVDQQDIPEDEDDPLGNRIGSNALLSLIG